MRREKIMQKVYAVLICLSVIFSFGAGGEVCGFMFDNTEKAFGNIFPDNNPKDIRHVMTKIAAEADAQVSPWNSAKIPVAVLTVQGSPRAVEAYNLETGAKLWRLDVPVNSPITLAGDLAIWKSGVQVVAHRIDDGRGVWNYRLEDGWNYYGADANDEIVALAVGVGGLEPGGYANGKIVVLNTDTGFKKWEHSAGNGMLGRPAVIGNLVFAPWDRQKIVIIDVTEGEEICRLRATDYAVNFIEKTKNALYYGSLASAGSLGTVYRFNEAAAAGTAEGTDSYSPTLKPVPGDPAFGRDAYELSNGGRSTEEKIRFHFVPTPNSHGAVQFEGDAFYLHYWAYIIAFDTATNAVKWTYRAPETIESMDVTAGGGIITVNAAGTLRYIDARTGTESWQLATGSQTLTAVFDADGFAPAAQAGTVASDSVESLKKLIMDKDNRLLPIRAYAVSLLAAIPKPEITKTLLEIYSDPASPKMLRLAIDKAVEKRTMGAEYLVSALNMKYDYLDETQPPPMKIVAPALIHMNEKEAVPALLGHLMNHETPIDDLVNIIAALHALGDATVVAPLTRLLTWYHADTSFLGHEQSLASAAYTLTKYGDKEPTEKFIAQIRDDAQTLPALKKLLRGLLDPAVVAREAAEARAKEEEANRQEEEKARLAAEAAFVPDSLSREQINKTIVDNQKVFAPCIMDALRKVPELRQIRLRFSLAGKTGKVSDLKVLPNNIEGLQTCLVGAFEKIKFRKAKIARQLATYTISIAPSKKSDEE